MAQTVVPRRVPSRFTKSSIFLFTFVLVAGTSAALVAQNGADAAPPKKCPGKSCKSDPATPTPDPSPSRTATRTPDPSPSRTATRTPDPSPSQTATDSATPTAQQSSGEVGIAQVGDDTGSRPQLQPLGEFPNPTNVGTPPNLTFTSTIDGDLHTQSDGQVIKATKVSGTLFVENDNVTVLDSRVLKEVKVVGPDTTGFRIWTTTIGTDSGVRAGQALGSRNLIARRIEILGTFDGIKAQGNVDVRDSYIHDLYRTTDTTQSNGMTHNDCVQIQSGGDNVFDHNTIDCWSFGDGEVAGAHNGVTPFNGEGYTTSAFMISACCGDITGVTINNNRISGATSKHVIVTTTGPVSNVSITNNFIGPDSRDWPNWHSTYLGANSQIANNTSLEDGAPPSPSSLISR